MEYQEIHTLDAIGKEGSQIKFDNGWDGVGVFISH